MTKEVREMKKPSLLRIRRGSGMVVVVGGDDGRWLGPILVSHACVFAVGTTARRFSVSRKAEYRIGGKMSQHASSVVRRVVR